MLLSQAGADLAADPYSDELQLIDTAMAAIEEAAARLRARFALRTAYPNAQRDGGGEWPGDDEEYEDVLTARTAAVLALAGEELSTQAWQDVQALGDEPLRRGAGGVFGQLPSITLRRDGQWRRQLARAFDDLTGDLRSAAGPTAEPRCTGEEMALHLMISRARSITANRPKSVRDLVAELPASEADYDWSGCSEILFEDHDVLMLFDDQLDGMADPESDVHQSMGMVNLAADDWFEPFRTDNARDPHRGFRHCPQVEK